MDPQLRTSDTDLQECMWSDCTLPRIHEGLCDGFPPIILDYTNWKGKRARRRVCPTGVVMHQATQWHKVPQWLFEVIDCEDGKKKLFSMIDVHSNKDVLQAAIMKRWVGHE